MGSLISTENFLSILFLKYQTLKIAEIVALKEIIEKKYPNILIELSSDSIDNVKYYYSNYFNFDNDSIQLIKNKKFLINELSQLNDDIKKNIENSLG